MKRLIVILAAALAAVAVTASVIAQTGETPFPSPKVTGVFVASQTVTAPGSTLGAGVLLNRFVRGSTVVFRAYAGEQKSGTLLGSGDVKYFYVKIPDQPNVKLAYSKANDPTGPWLWKGTWTIPADYPLGLVNLNVLIQTTSKRYGSFVQIPVASAQLTVIKA